MLFGKVFAIFTFQAIFIACLGLFGLSSYLTLQRTQEIGIRKVLGSSSRNAVLLLTRYFIIQVLIAIPFGLVIGYFVRSGWMQNFAYRTIITWWSLVLPVLLVLVVSILTISVQVLKTANINPATSLRKE